MASDMKMLQALMAKKGKSKMEPEHKKVKMDLLKELKSTMGKDMGSDLMGMKKVTVAAPDKEGLEKGLDKAKELAMQMPEEGGSEDLDGADSEQEDAEEESEDKGPQGESDEMSMDELDAKIKELEDLKKAKMMKA